MYVYCITENIMANIWCVSFVSLPLSIGNQIMVPTRLPSKDSLGTKATMILQGLFLWTFAICMVFLIVFSILVVAGKDYEKIAHGLAILTLVTVIEGIITRTCMAIFPEPLPQTVE